MSALPSEPVHLISEPDQEPTRLRLLGELSEPASASELGKRLRLPRQRVNYHLRELERAGLVRLVEQRRKGNCTERLVQAIGRSYLVSPDAMKALSPDPERVRDRFSSAYLVAAFARVIRDVAILRRRAAAAKQALATFTLETEIRFASARAQHAFVEALGDAVARLVAEHHDEQTLGGRRFRLVLGAHPAITKTEQQAAADAAASSKPSEKDPPPAGAPAGASKETPS